MGVGVVRRAIDQGWTVRATAGPVPEHLASALTGVAAVAASVPGVVHLDLLAAGLIPDPHLDLNESLLTWIGLVDWTYGTTLPMTAAELAAAERHEIVFDGLDTVATVLLNGQVIAEVANQHRTHRLDVTGILTEGDNLLEVRFRSPVKYANAQSLTYGARPGPYPMPFEAIRKSACSFGWDWGPATFTSGIWRPVHLVSWSGARFDEVLVRADAVGDGGRVEVVARVASTSDAARTVTVSVAGASASATTAAGERKVTASVECATVDRWWPTGHGDQPLYDIEVELACDGAVLDRVRRRVGFRTLHWDTTPDAAGTPFQLVVNDRPILVKGVNWIPDDSFPVRVDRARYAQRLTQARAANVNLVRVWGGGTYESDTFYDLCDELGLVTWQDFLFACAAYPEEEPLRSEVEVEARQNVARLAHHASLALLTGNNENLWGYEDWGWKERLDGRTWGAHYYDELLPAVVAEVAPHVPYAPGSPFSPGGQHPNDPSHGTTHLWEQWNSLDWATYRDIAPRFVAEFGWQGPPTWSTLTTAISDDPLTPESPGMLAHQKAVDGNAKLVGGLVRHHRVPDDMATWHWAMQLNQANAITCALDWFRFLAPSCSGAVVWQLNDCWPVTSWAAIDGSGREKPLYFALQNAFAPRVVSVQPRGGRLVASLGNDTDVPWEGSLTCRRLRFDGTVCGSKDVAVSVPARGSVTIDLPAVVADADDPASEVVVVETLGTRGSWFFCEPRDSALPPAALEVSVAATDAGFDVSVTARTLVRDLTLLIDKVDPAARVDRGLVTLLPGESATFRVTGVGSLDVGAVCAPGILRCGNELMNPT